LFIATTKNIKLIPLATKTKSYMLEKCRKPEIEKTNKLLVTVKQLLVVTKYLMTRDAL